MRPLDAGHACGDALRETLPRAASTVGAVTHAPDSAMTKFPGAIVGGAFVASSGFAIALRAFQMWRIRRRARPRQTP